MPKKAAGPAATRPAACLLPASIGQQAFGISAAAITIPFGWEDKLLPPRSVVGLCDAADLLPKGNKRPAVAPWAVFIVRWTPLVENRNQ